MVFNLGFKRVAKEKGWLTNDDIAGLTQQL
jgi:hypothetical protein